jgi:prefoldin subunit 5
MHSPDDAATGCETISLVSHLESANEKLRQAVAELARETETLRHQLEKMDAETCRQESNDDL